MKWTPLLLVVSLLAWPKAPVDPLLEKYAADLGKAQSVIVKVRVFDLSGASDDESLTISRPNLWKYDTSKWTVISDGEKITTYNKSAKTYVLRPYSAKALAALTDQPQLWPYASLLNDKFLTEILASRRGAQRSTMGTKVIDLNVSRDGKGQITLVVDSTTGLVRGVNFKDATGKEKIAQASEVQLLSKPMDAAKFAWVAPEGAQVSKEDEEAAPMALKYADVAGIFERNCTECHSGSDPKDGIDLASYDSIMSARIVRPGDADGSKLIRVIRSGKMPPKERMDPKDLAALTQWVNSGAKP